jgi:hypothetical protein
MVRQCSPCLDAGGKSLSSAEFSFNPTQLGDFSAVFLLQHRRRLGLSETCHMCLLKWVIEYEYRFAEYEYGTKESRRPSCSYSYSVRRTVLAAENMRASKPGLRAWTCVVQ